ncbi:Zinc transporter 1 [Linum grandiflorum]
MMFAIGTLSMESLAMGFYKRRQLEKTVANDDGDREGGVDRKVDGDYEDEMLRRRIVSQILEMGVVVHSTIIGLSLGTSKSTKTIKPLMAALSFHQLFEGVGLGGSITQAKLKLRTRILMAIFFSLTTPVGIGIGMAISSKYTDNSPNSLIVQGTFTSASAGILVYMALVDLLATDFMSSNMLLSDFRIQFGAYASLFLGAGSMSVLALVA